MIHVRVCATRDVDRETRSLNTCKITSYLQRFALTVEQLRDVPGHFLHQVFGVVSFDFKLALLFTINLQIQNIGKTNISLTEPKIFINYITLELFV